jgi:hypothetical protein
LAFFSKTNVMIKFLKQLAVFWAKNANIIAKFFGENILKNHNICPRDFRIWRHCSFFLSVDAILILGNWKVCSEWFLSTSFSHGLEVLYTGMKFWILIIKIIYGFEISYPAHKC